MDNDSLYALKVHYSDMFQDERDIILMLKIELFNNHMEEDAINNRLKEFYNSLNMDIDIDVFKGIRIFDFLLYTHILTNVEEENTSVTLNNQSIEKLKKYKLENKLSDECLICVDCMDINQEVIELSCNHIYHSNCITEYLTKYNYKCPYCDKDLR